MRVRVRDQQGMLSGLLFLTFATVGLFVSWDYPLGTAVRMSAGYFPRLLCILLASLGALICFRSMTVDGAVVGRVRLRPVVMVPIAVLAFAFTVEQFGLVLATVLVTILGGLASPQTRFREAAVAAIVLAAIACVIFVWAIGLPIAVWPEI